MANKATTHNIHPGLTQRFGKVRLQTLISLRWLGISGQTISLLMVYFGLGLAFPLWSCLGIVGASALLNVIAMRFAPHTTLLTPTSAVWQMGFDIVQVSTLLAFTGGIANPFLVLLLAPAIISATILPLQQTLALVGLTIFSITVIADFNFPLPTNGADILPPTPLYQTGLAIAVVIALLFIAGYAWRVAEEGRRMAEALTATQAVLHREQRLSSLGSLAAAAAHELGTPLGTIYLIAKDFKRACKDDEHLASEAQQLIEQATRCREILRRLSAGGEVKSEFTETTELKGLLEEIAAPLRSIGPVIHLDIHPLENTDAGLKVKEPEVRRLPEIIYGLGNLLENATEFGRSLVHFEASYDEQYLIIEIEDDGPGFAPEILSKLGEPYISTRSSGTDQRIYAETKEGMGLGFFIAKTLLERTGASLEFSNIPEPDNGALIKVTWPRAAVAA